MGDRWMDERDQAWRDRDWRRWEAYGGGEPSSRADEAGRWREERSWYGGSRERREPGERAAHGEQARGDYGREGYGREDYGRRSGVTAGGGGYGRDSSARGDLRVSSQDYTGQDCRRGDDGGPSRGGRSYGAEDYPERRRDPYGRSEAERRYAQAEPPEARGDRPGELLHRAGERISSWFRGDNLMRGSREDDQGEPRRYREDWGREARPIPEPSHRGRGPKGYQRSDARISDEVHDRLTDDPWLDASNIEVTVKDGEVALGGHVDNREAKHRAERIIENVAGVRHVQNNLRVDPDAGLTSAGHGYGSSALEAQMRRDVAARDPGDNGVSGLSGRTSTGAEAERSTKR